MLKRSIRFVFLVALLCPGNVLEALAQESLALNIVNQGKPPAVPVQLSAFRRGAKQPLQGRAAWATARLQTDLSSNGHDLQLGDLATPDGADPSWVSPGKP